VGWDVVEEARFEEAGPELVMGDVELLAYLLDFLGLVFQFVDVVAVGQTVKMFFKDLKSHFVDTFT
jgi:hypothetical protein